MNSWIYHFGANHVDGDGTMQALLGSKGAGLAAMSKAGLPVPAGFTITTELCSYYHAHKILPPEFIIHLKDAIIKLEAQTNKSFGGNNNSTKLPLLLSIRSGSVVSMPGMMDTVLNLGINDQICDMLAEMTGNRLFALDSYRRFLEMYGSIVLEVPQHLLTYTSESNLDITSLQYNIDRLKRTISKHSGREVHSDPYQQLLYAIEAVLRSWQNSRAIIYRKLHNISESLGTAVNVQAMVFGNMGPTSATGVVFTRCPIQGENRLFGEFLINAQGEDIVSGTCTPTPITSETNGLQILMPQMFYALQAICHQLEELYLDVQDIEFTIENNKLYILQTRSAKRTTKAAVKIAVDLVLEGIITKRAAIMRIDPDSLEQLLHNNVDYSMNPRILAQGLPASPGAAAGIAVFTAHDAEELSRRHRVILIRHDTDPEDIRGMHFAHGILTARGGMTSHAAVVTRGMGKPCICGASSIIIDEVKRTCKIGDVVIKQGDEISIDGSIGNILYGIAPMSQPTFFPEFKIIMSWADEIRDLQVRANAETVQDVITALQFEAEGVGLCRTEHMFFDRDKIKLIRKMIIATDYESRLCAINTLLPLQVHDFKNLFRLLRDKPINIRLLDPPLHEFLPKSVEDKTDLAKALNVPLSLIDKRLQDLNEANPMLGHRGCRLGISYPELYQMQVQAVCIAVQELLAEKILVQLELMIPLVSNVNELSVLKNYINETISKYAPSEMSYSIGTMIELPRAALQADKIAKQVAFFSFGTNDLTQTTYGMSRDDIGVFINTYIEREVIEADPFVQIDQEGVGELMKIAIDRGIAVNPQLKLGVCGEHAGNPRSIQFFHNIGLHYVSCSPFRIPIAKIAAAQAKILATN